MGQINSNADQHGGVGLEGIPDELQAINLPPGCRPFHSSNLGYIDPGPAVGDTDCGQVREPYRVRAVDALI